MPQYQAHAMDNDGHLRVERVEAASERDAMEKLQQKKLVVLELKVSTESAPVAEEKVAVKTPSVRISVVLGFYEQLGFLIKSGIPVFHAIRMLSETLKNKNLTSILKNVLYELSEGFPLSGSLQKYPNAFPSLHTHLISVGEKSGNLDSALHHLVELVKEGEDIRDKIIKASVYPLFLLTMAGSLVLGLLFFVFPKFEEIFKSFNVNLPPTTTFFLQASQYSRNNAVLIFSLLGGAGLGLFYFLRSERVSESRDKCFLALPLFRDVLVSMFVALFAKTLASLLRAGIPLLEGLSICQHTMSGKLKRDFFDKLIATVREGEKVSKGMEGSPFIPEMARQLVMIGEATGNLDLMLENIFTFYKRRYTELLTQLTAVLQPLLLFFAAGLIALVAMSLFVPLFKLGSAMRSGS